MANPPEGGYAFGQPGPHRRSFPKPRSQRTLVKSHSRAGWIDGARPCTMAQATLPKVTSSAFGPGDVPSLRGGFAMHRQCSRCGQAFTAHDLCKDVTKNVEAQRMANGVDGVLFRVYTCGHCACDDVFVDVCPLAGETDAD